ncbi:Crp/Fnr family transcriptional regulator [Sphingomonas lenta]|uniref:Crp/Fnr family transcriptional regulator n=1 Tax=Sphingomonas lenta TaxID=1141887 RepID=UPI001FE2A6FB|nr:Crp/Fnr family transcriptional regulator [Sphingomonas lenta]
MRGLLADTRSVEARRTVIREGERLEASTLLLDGLMCRYKDLRNGQRQVTELHVPGDFADMHSFTLKRLDHNVQTLTDCVIGLVPHERIQRMTETHPRLARLYWFGTNLDAAIHREWEVSLGKRWAAERTAALFCEMHVRLGLVGMADPDGYGFPLTQTELAECLGITPIHLNRTLKELREAGLVEFRSRYVSLLDLPRLRSMADFDENYLYLDPDPL